MKRLFPFVLAMASFTIVGCKNQHKPAASPASGAEVNAPPSPQPYTPPADNGTNLPPPTADNNSIPANTGTETTEARPVTHHHAYSHHETLARHGKYVVKKGDTLSKIAHAHHVSLKRLEAANPKVDPNRIHVGQTIMIP